MTLAITKKEKRFLKSAWHLLVFAGIRDTVIMFQKELFRPSHEISIQEINSPALRSSV